MSHYTVFNLSYQAREESVVVVKMMGIIAEAFVFTYLGLTALYYLSRTLSISFILIELVFVLLGRTIAIFGISFIMK
jgi:NhaP-type Na+/H+ or K+/H+ antiporter